jgi:murein L,D-transpeptidase YcbB/YkuD
MLTAWGRSNALPKPLSDTPVFGKATTEAVKQFQRAQGIKPTGKVGRKTWDALGVAARKRPQSAPS